MDVLAEPLDPVQLRILGVLVEKQLTTPAAYPLSEPALLTGCNQTTNRDPVVELGTAQVRPALIRLRERGLAARVRRPGDRVEKHEHRLDSRLGLSSPAPLAVLTVLMLRGPQTPGELRSRVQRLCPVATGGALEAALAELRDRGFAEPLPRRGGEKQVRWQQLLGGPVGDDVAGRSRPGSAAAGGPQVGPVTDGWVPPEPAPPTGREAGPAAPPALVEEGALLARLSALEARVTALEDELRRSGRPGTGA